MASSPPLPDAAAKLLDFSQPFDVPLLDATVNAFYGAGSNDEVGGEIEKEEGEGNKSGRERECTVGIDESTSCWKNIPIESASRTSCRCFVSPFAAHRRPQKDREATARNKKRPGLDAA